MTLDDLTVQMVSGREALAKGHRFDFAELCRKVLADDPPRYVVEKLYVFAAEIGRLSVFNATWDELFPPHSED